MIRKAAVVVCILAIGFSFVGWFSIRGDKNVSEIIELLKIGVGDEVIKAHIADRGMTFDLSTREIAMLKKSGASDDLLSFMIASGAGDFPFELDGGFLVEKPVVHKHLAIFPVFRRSRIELGDYMSLDEAQRAGVIVITEHGSGSVPTVIIRNRGRRDIYIMAGEIIIGGKQDRMISYDVLIPAGDEVEVSVRCVEHGRWRGDTPVFESGGALGSGGVRAALQFKAQQEVWDEVSRACEKHDATTESGTYRAIVSSKDVDSRSKPFLDSMNRGLQDDDMVGMIVALNGEVVCVDIFSSPKFFEGVKEKLLKAYVLDAISARETNTRPPSKGEILAFFEELEDADTDELKVYGANRNTQLESEEIIGSESRDKEGMLQHLNLYKRR